MAEPSRKPARGLGMALLLLVFGVLLAVSAFIGLMIATAGTAVHPPLVQVAAPFLCNDDFVIESQSYSYKPGQSGVSHQIHCVQADGSRKEVTLRAVFVAFLVYWAIALALGLVLVVPLLRWLRRHARRLQAPLAWVGSQVQARLTTGLQQDAAMRRIVVDGREYASADELPPQARDACAQAMQALAVGGGQAVDAGEDVAARLRKLQQLRDAGLITQQDYQDKKADILSRL